MTYRGVTSKGTLLGKTGAIGVAGETTVGGIAQNQSGLELPSFEGFSEAEV